MLSVERQNLKFKIRAQNPNHKFYSKNPPKGVFQVKRFESKKIISQVVGNGK